MAMQRIIEVTRCRPEGGTFVALGSRELAVFLIGDPPNPVVIDNACPHASGNLSGGTVDGSVVTCPWHEWRFDLATGVCVHSDLAKVTRYPVDVRDGVLFADLDAAF